ncbi:MAG: chaperone NapD [Thermoanaerobaculia bacterium]|nr:chaperone NapD [Thermoanaerobaculia bacterium]MBP9824655.1 chaperone NapD [Thermoanaerobaculia bacterium]
MGENVFEPPSPESPQCRVRHYAGVLISIEPARLTEVRQSLDSTPGVAVHHLDPAIGRCVAVLESADRTEGERLFDAVGRLPHVRSVEFVHHVVDHEAAGAGDATESPQEQDRWDGPRRAQPPARPSGPKTDPTPARPSGRPQT